MNSASNDNINKLSAKDKCPICKVLLSERASALADEFSPFCSRRCSDVDLNRWLSGNYAIPATDGDSDEVMNINDES